MDLLRDLLRLLRRWALLRDRLRRIRRARLLLPRVCFPAPLPVGLLVLPLEAQLLLALRVRLEFSASVLLQLTRILLLFGWRHYKLHLKSPR